MQNEKLNFSSDYMEGAHPAILRRLIDTNMIKSAGYGLDEFSESARQKIRSACEAPEADIFFLVGGTQTNATVIDAILKPYQGVIAADTGHISTHEAGAIELGGHKVLAIPSENGKISAASVRCLVEEFYEDENHDHMVMPGMVYISQPTESGTLYSLKELEELHTVCTHYHLPLYMDGARMAYALACPSNDAKLSDIARLCDAFYIGGTKCGALFGEALVFPKHDFVPHFFTIMKQRGALLAKGRIAGLQFDTLFSDNLDNLYLECGHLYLECGRIAVSSADRLREAFAKKGYTLAFDSPTNQLFVILDDRELAALKDKVDFSFWEKTPDGRTIVRLATSWATQPEDVDRLIEIL